jgi:glucokinase
MNSLSQARDLFPSGGAVSYGGGLAIGLDVGGTKIAGGLVDLDAGKVLARRTIPTNPQRGGGAVLTDVIALGEELKAAAEAGGGTVRCIGVGVAELVDREGRVRSSNLIAWEGLPVQEWLSGIAPAVVESDVRAAALAEARYGAGRDFGLFVYVTVGTGISSCLVQDGRPFKGARGNALVMASSPLSVPCDACCAVTRHVLEEYASGPAIVARYRERSGLPVERAEEVMAAVAAGDRVADEVAGSAGEALGSSVGFLVNVLDPEAVIVGGGLGLAGGLYWECFVRSTRAHVWSEETRDLPIVPAGLGTDAGLIGAAVAAADAARGGNAG